ncbi:MAG TPA: M20 aminoacylase family protein [Sphingobium sp.]|uniref:M20 aminoacylase family protein n=1 Tax=Sphingobium sp. TaxID=1912891 RepID=UPI002ED6C12E
MAADLKFARSAERAVTWRRQLHQIPELQFDLPATSAFVAERLGEFGCDEIFTGIAHSGIVALIRGKLGVGPAIALRADMDALPTREETGFAYASRFPNQMHACGHDGHSAILLGAAEHLAATRYFCGTAVLIFQPAEEGGGGGKAMLDENIMERFEVSRVFALHNMPGIPVGHFAIRPGPIMASGARLSIVVRGKGGHAALPHETIDPIVVSAQLILSLQTIASRSVNPLDPIALSITKLASGLTTNVIPETVEIGGTVRTLSVSCAELAEARIREICSGMALAHGCAIDVEYRPIYPVTVNDPAEARFAGDVAASIVGEDHVDRSTPPLMGAEDFSFMLQARPGAFIFLGNGDSAGLHHPRYDFNDEAIPYGIAYFAALVETALQPV